MEPRPDYSGRLKLREACGGQPADAVGTVVELLPTEALIEIADEHGRTVELVTVAYEALRVRESEPARRRAAG